MPVYPYHGQDNSLPSYSQYPRQEPQQLQVKVPQSFNQHPQHYTMSAHDQSELFMNMNLMTDNLPQLTEVSLMRSQPPIAFCHQYHHRYLPAVPQVHMYEQRLFPGNSQHTPCSVHDYEHAKQEYKPSDQSAISGTSRCTGDHPLDLNMPMIPVPRPVPPLKPKQSGHALWVGNLPGGATITDLKDHFSREATQDIESLFLISTSNCAFVNYRTEGSCTAALHRFHDSKFHDARLVCRLRRATVTASDPGHSKQKDATDNAQNENLLRGIVGGGSSDWEEVNAADKVPERFFIVKSLTVQALEASVRNGVWATQTHNEERLNSAYESADNVYLIFSANRSGEFFGFARMTSPISDRSSNAVNVLSRLGAIDASDAPKSIPTPATAHAPRGRITDDPARGAIFWEAELSESEMDASTKNENGAKQLETEKLFEVNWKSTRRLPFFQTRGLRNPRNANKEVKIARDGTELEPSVGIQLIKLFR